MATQASQGTQASSDEKSEGFLQKLQKRAKPFQGFLNKFNNDWSMNFAGMLAYNLLTSILPIAVATFGVFGLILSNDNFLQQKIIEQLPSLFPGTASEAIKGFLQGAIAQLQKDGGLFVIIAILLAIFGGSRLFITIENCLDIVYRVRPRPLIRQNAIAIMMMFIFIVLIPIMFLTSTAPAFILQFLNGRPELKLIPFFSLIAGSSITAYLVGILSSLLASFLLFEAIYVIVPNQKVSWKHSWRGALTSSILLVLFLQLFPLYTANFLKGYSGTLGLAVIIILFFYYFAVILMLGAEVNAYFFESVKPLPNDLVTFVSTMAGKLNKDFTDVESEHHVDTKPTEHADRAHIVEERTKEEANQRDNAKQQQEIAAKPVTRERAKQDKEQKEQVQKQGSSRLVATLGVVFGSVITVVLELLRQRRRS